MEERRVEERLGRGRSSDEGRVDVSINDNGANGCMNGPRFRCEWGAKRCKGEEAPGASAIVYIGKRCCGMQSVGNARVTVLRLAEY